jgi:hypothetical protein
MAGLVPAISFRGAICISLWITGTNPVLTGNPLRIGQRIAELLAGPLHPKGGSYDQTFEVPELVRGLITAKFGS